MQDVGSDIIASCMNLIHNLTQQEAEENLDKQVEIIRLVSICIEFAPYLHQNRANSAWHMELFW